MKFFKDHLQTSVQAILARLLEAGTSNKSQTRDDADCKFAWSFSLQNELDFAALKSIGTRPLENAHFIKALSNMLEDGEKSVGDFEKQLAEVVAHEKRKYGRSAEKWIHVQPFHIATDVRFQRPKSFLCFGTRFRIGKWSQLIRPAKQSAVEELIAEEGAANGSVLFGIESSAVGPSGPHSWDQIEPAFDALRGVIHWALVSGRIQRNPALPHGRVRFLPWAVAWRMKTPTPEFYWFTGMEKDSLPFEPEKLSQEDFDKILSLTKRVKRPAQGDDVRGVIADALRLYAQALSAPSSSQCFLGLWQMAEAMTLGGGKGGKGEAVCSRLLVVAENSLGCAIECGYEILWRLYTIRNDISHPGIHHAVDDEHINILKIMCEELLDWLLKHSAAIGDRERLEHFFRYATLNDKAQLLELRGIKLWFEKLCDLELRLDARPMR